jgi:hypothetical protein
MMPAAQLIMLTIMELVIIITDIIKITAFNPQINVLFNIRALSL